MTKKNELEIQRELLEQQIKKRYSIPWWNQLKDAAGFVLIAFFILLCVLSAFYVLFTLIENPISLAIICATILLIIFWSFK